MSEHLLIADEPGGVRRITLARPVKRNALTRPMMQALADAFAAAEADPDVRVVLFDSQGRVFCAGADLDGLAGEPLTKETDPGHQYLKIIAAAKKPLVAAVQGPAVGIGTTQLLHFDLVYAAPEATFRTAFVDLGLTPEAGASFILPERMGHLQAARLLLLGEAIDAVAALHGGLISEIVPAEALDEHAGAAARRLAAKPPEALAMTKRMMRGEADLLAAMDHEQDVFRERMHAQEFHAALDALRARFAPASDA